MVPEQFGRQPARDILKARGWSITAAAEELKENRSHLNAALLGRVPPCDALRESLPRMLGIPLEKLFTHELLALPYGRSRYSGEGGHARQVRKTGPRRPKRVVESDNGGER